MGNVPFALGFPITKSREDPPLTPPGLSMQCLCHCNAQRRAAINTTSCTEKSFATSFSRGLGLSSCPALFPSTQIWFRKYRSPYRWKISFVWLTAFNDTTGIEHHQLRGVSVQVADRKHLSSIIHGLSRYSPAGKVARLTMKPKGTFTFTLIVWALATVVTAKASAAVNNRKFFFI